MAHLLLGQKHLTDQRKTNQILNTFISARKIKILFLKAFRNFCKAAKTNEIESAYVPLRLQIQTNQGWLQRLGIRCGRDGSQFLLVHPCFSSWAFVVHVCVETSRGTTRAAVTFMVVVEDAVVGAGVRMRVPEGGRAEAERRGHVLHLGQSLLQLSPQSLHEPVGGHSPNPLKLGF